MGIAHRYTGDLPLTIPNGDRCFHNLVAGQLDRNLLRCQHRLSHIHRDRFGFAVTHRQLQRFDTAQRIDSHGFAMHPTTVVQIFAHATDTVAAHLAFAAIQIEDAHLRVRHLRRVDQNHAVAADTGMEFGQPHTQRFGIAYRLIKAIEINVIIATALHFDKG